MKFTTKINKHFWVVKKAFVDKEGKLLRQILPMGSELVYYKGLRRGAIAKILMLGKLLTFKVITYNTDRHKLYFNDIHKDGNFFGIKFWSHRHTVEKLASDDNKTIITDEVAFTTKNRLVDFFYGIFIRLHFGVRILKYKLFFLF
tara:strand:- start:7984 stop:8418 length:435 start_codon:yes stop_codon:yes gene_type:complete